MEPTDTTVRRVLEEMQLMEARLSERSLGAVTALQSDWKSAATRSTITSRIAATPSINRWMLLPFAARSDSLLCK